MYNHINKGDKVCWHIGEQQVRGQVVDMYKHKVTHSNNKIVFNNIDSHSPEGIRHALLIELEDGRKVLKLEDEVTRVW